MAKSLPCGYELRVSRERDFGLWRLFGLEPCDRSGSCCPSASNAPWHGRSRRGRSFLAPSFLLGGEEGARPARQSSAGVGNIQGKPRKTSALDRDICIGQASQDHRNPPQRGYGGLQARKLLELGFTRWSRQGKRRFREQTPIRNMRSTRLPIHKPRGPSRRSTLCAPSLREPSYAAVHARHTCISRDCLARHSLVQHLSGA